jgi:glycosyltransferase involved in cell wall biosynthesis
MRERVALLVPNLGGGGAERVMVDLGNDLARRGLRVDLLVALRGGVLAAPDGGGYVEGVAPEVRVVPLDARRTLLSIPPLVRYLRRERPAALLATLTHANVVAVWARRLAGVSTRVVIREANTLSRHTRAAVRLRDRALPWLTRRFYPWADAIVAVSEGVADDLATLVPRDRVCVLDNPVVGPGLAALAAEPVDHPWLSTDQSRPVVLGVGRLTAQKDFQTLLRAFALVRARRDVRLLILGEGEQRPALERLAGELGIAAAVDLPGFESNPFAYMARAAVFALSSAWEGSPNVLIQAMAAGAPVVATDCASGPREILGGGRHGRLVPVGDAEALASAIDRTLAEPRRSPPATAWQRFSLDASVDGYLRILGLHRVGSPASPERQAVTHGGALDATRR